MTDRNKPLILTFSGKEINPTDPDPALIDIEDIAQGLACFNRFVGQTKRPISVAQHSIYVSRLCKDPVARFQGLLHDASEAYLGDITKWLKAHDAMAMYREVEEHVQRLIYRKFNLPEETHPEVERADRIMVRWEGQQGFGRSVWSKWSEKFPAYPVVTEEERAEIAHWGFWPWHVSRAVFLGEFRGQAGTLAALDRDRFGFLDPAGDLGRNPAQS